MKLASICILNANKKQSTAGIHWKAPSVYAKAHPNNTGVAAAAKVFGRAAKIHAFIELVRTFSIVIAIEMCYKDSTSSALKKSIRS